MRKFHVQFNEKNLTGNAGLTLLGRFAEKLELPKMLKANISIERGATAKYQPADAIMMLMMGVLAGAKHLSHLIVLRTDHALRALFRWENFPDDTTVSRIFKLFTPRHCKELSDVETIARKKVWGKKWHGRVTMDMDSTVRGVYGCQEGAKKGYNPWKKGQKSYHPLLCFVAETRECPHNWFRSGDAHSANGSVEFMKECFAKLPWRVWKVTVRADSAFFDGKLLDFIEEKHSDYIVKVNLRNLESLMLRQKWVKVPKMPDYEKTEFFHECDNWTRSRRFVAIRRAVEIEDDSGNLALFKEAKIKYEYFCYVLNLKLSPWAAHKYYGKRATSENWIEWCKTQMASGSILTDEFRANSAIFQSCILAYNLMVWMMLLNDENGFREEPGTIRMFLIRVPARLLRNSRQWFLRLHRDWPFKDRWQKLETSILSLNFA